MNRCTLSRPLPYCPISFIESAFSQHLLVSPYLPSTVFPLNSSARNPTCPWNESMIGRCWRGMDLCRGSAARCFLGGAHIAAPAVVRTRPHDPRRDLNHANHTRINRWVAARRGYAAGFAAILSATLASAIARMRRCVRSTRARLLARPLSSSTPTP